MAKFVQIGNRAFNLEHIITVWFDVQDWGDPRTEIYFDAHGVEGPQSLGLVGDEAQAFKAWWENHADVYHAV